MLDFLYINCSTDKTGRKVIKPDFLVKKSKDLMIRGGEFYAIWDEDKKLWVTDWYEAISLIDRELYRYRDTELNPYESEYAQVHTLVVSSNGSITRWRTYCENQMADSYVELDSSLTFADTPLERTTYASKRLDYVVAPGTHDAWDRLVHTLYSPIEALKIEWTIGAIVSGASRDLQKFCVFYGAPGTGKSTILNIIDMMFSGYTCAFDAKALGSNKDFTLESLANNALVAIQHDGDLSRIEDNTKLNSIVSHETMLINQKYKTPYSARIRTMLLLGTNSAVNITDAYSGILRRMIDIEPTGNLIPVNEYDILMGNVKKELGAIAHHCLQLYLDYPKVFHSYRPVKMMRRTNLYHDFMLTYRSIFESKVSWPSDEILAMYNEYRNKHGIEKWVLNNMNMCKFVEPYFKDNDVDKVSGATIYSHFLLRAEEDWDIPDSLKLRIGLPVDNDVPQDQNEPESNIPDWLQLTEHTTSILDEYLAECPAQYAVSVTDGNTTIEKPKKRWVDCDTILKDIDTTQLHYVRAPKTHIFIDFDLKDEDGNKCMEKNIEAASKWPPTYTEVSKGGGGLHLHYEYTGKAEDLSPVYEPGIEVKICVKCTPIRRRLSKCNDLQIATVSSGLPIKEEKINMLSDQTIQNERHLRAIIHKALNKIPHGATTPSVHLIHKVLKEAYESKKIVYDVTDLSNTIYWFCSGSTNQRDHCLSLYDEMHLKSDTSLLDDEYSTGMIDLNKEKSDYPLVVFDIEVFPNVYFVCYKLLGRGGRDQVIRMVNPDAKRISDFVNTARLIGYNNKRYDNIILMAISWGYNNQQVYELSKTIVSGENYSPVFASARHLSYTDIYDFASAGNKMSLKKLEIKMGVNHQELGMDWDKPVPKERWDEVLEYCVNDVMATEAAFNYLKGDWTAREILADLTNGSVNESTNNLSKMLIFGDNKKPQSAFNYRDLSKPVPYTDYEFYRFKFGDDYDFRVWDENGLPCYRSYVPGEVLPEGYSILPFWPDYTFDRFAKKDQRSKYKGVPIGEGGLVYGSEGMYFKAWDADVTGQHPSSMIAERLFGPAYTKVFSDIVSSRVKIKHGELDDVRHLFDGKLVKHIERIKNGEIKSKDLANALKTVVNSVYGQTAATYECAFKDPRNVDNIVAKRGALFMSVLKEQVEQRGFKVAHIKTDSIKIPEATPELRDFVINFGKEYGYEFETEAEFKKFCLVNNAVYIAQNEDNSWTAVGLQFARPYVFKTLFSKQPVVFGDCCETFAVQNPSAIYMDHNEDLPDVSAEEKELEKLMTKYKQGKISDTMFEAEGDRLRDIIEEGHDRRFVGSVGHFVPVVPGIGGSRLIKSIRGKWQDLPKTSPYRWYESSMLMSITSVSTFESDEGELSSFFEMEINDERFAKYIDLTYFNDLVDEAYKTISKYGDADAFINDPDYYVDPNFPSFMNVPVTDNEEYDFFETPANSTADELPFV